LNNFFAVEGKEAFFLVKKTFSCHRREKGNLPGSEAVNKYCPKKKTVYIVPGRVSMVREKEILIVGGVYMS